MPMPENRISITRLNAWDRQRVAASVVAMLCEQSGQNQGEIAKAMGVRTSLFAEWCQGAALIPVTKIRLLQQATNASQEDIAWLQQLCLPALDAEWRNKFLDTPNARAGAFLAALREAMGMERHELAKKLAVANNTIRRWEVGENQIDPGKLKAIKQALSLTDRKNQELEQAVFPILDTNGVANGVEKHSPVHAGELIRAYRKIRGINTETLTSMIGCTPSRLQNWETDGGGLDASVFPKIYKALNLTQDEYRALLLVYAPALNPEYLEKQVPPKRRAGTLLAIYRNLLGEGQVSFSKRDTLRISQTLLWQWEQGNRTISKNHENALVEIFNKAQEALPPETRWFDEAYFRQACARSRDEIRAGWTAARTHLGAAHRATAVEPSLNGKAAPHSR